MSNRPAHDPHQRDAQAIAAAILERRRLHHLPKADSLVAASERETRMRMQVYPNRVSLGRMSPQKAADEILAMEGITEFIQEACQLFEAISQDTQRADIRAAEFLAKFGRITPPAPEQPALF